MGRKNGNARKTRKTTFHLSGTGSLISKKKISDSNKQIDKMFDRDNTIKPKSINSKKKLVLLPPDFDSVVDFTNIEINESEELNELINGSFDNDTRLPVGFFTDNDESLDIINNADRIINDFLELIDSLNACYDHAVKKLSEAERKKNDIEHNIELEYENCYQTWIIARAFKYVLMERRDYKNIINKISIIKDIKANYPDLKKILDRLKDDDDKNSNRIYCPRSSLKLPVTRAFYSLSKEDQDILLNNLEAGRRRKK